MFYKKINEAEKMKVIIDADECIGCGLCEDLAPEIIIMNDDGVAEATREIEDDEKEMIEEAADACPVMAIKLE